MAFTLIAEVIYALNDGTITNVLKFRLYNVHELSEVRLGRYSNRQTTLTDKKIGNCSFNHFLFASDIAVRWSVTNIESSPYYLPLNLFFFCPLVRF